MDQFEKDKLWYYIVSDLGKNPTLFLTQLKIDETKDDYTPLAICIFRPVIDPG